MASTEDAEWAEFAAIRHSIKSYTVDRLKQIITGIAEETGASLAKAGRKQELIDRIVSLLEKLRYEREVEKWKKVRNVVQQVQVSAGYASMSPSAFGRTHTFRASSFGSYSAPSYSSQPSPVTGGSSSLGRYDPYAPPVRVAPSTSVVAAPIKPVTTGFPIIRFKASPFHRIEQAVSHVVECPESTGAMDRRNQSFNFSLTPEHIAKLSHNEKFQLRLYCTSSAFYSNSPSGFRSSNSICPIEFPATCELRVNQNLVSANTKGIKKKPGTAPPADISKYVKISAGFQNRAEMVYVNSQATNSNQAAVPKKFYLVVNLVELSSVEQLVDRLKKGKFRTSEAIKAQMAKNASLDDDIELGKATLNLKCPLSYTRITVPARSEDCVHSQCFDAVSWYSVMEQTTTWLCPICDKMLKYDDIIVDGFFQAILEATPDSVDDVELEPNGEWHTSDSKYGSQKWMKEHGKPAEPLKVYSTAESQNRSQSSSDLRVKAEPSEVLILDSDSEEEEERAKREVTSTMSKRPGSTAFVAVNASGVIDLTLDSDDDEPQPIRPPPPKRKAVEPIDVSPQKRGRSDTGLTSSGSTIVGHSEPFISRPLAPPLSRHPSMASSPSAALHSPPMSSPSSPYHAHRLPAVHSSPNGGAYANGSYSQLPAPNGTHRPYVADMHASRSTHVEPTRFNTYRDTNGANGSAWP